MVDEISLLTLKQFQQLFPDCRIVTEKLLGIFAKSYIAIWANPDGEKARANLRPPPVYLIVREPPELIDRRLLSLNSRKLSL